MEKMWLKLPLNVSFSLWFYDWCVCHTTGCRRDLKLLEFEETLQGNTEEEVRSSSGLPLGGIYFTETLLWCKVWHKELCFEGAMQCLPTVGQAGWIQCLDPKEGPTRLGEREGCGPELGGGRIYNWAWLFLMTASQQLLCSLANTSYCPTGKHPRTRAFFPQCLLVERRCWWSSELLLAPKFSGQSKMVEVGDLLVSISPASSVVFKILIFLCAMLISSDLTLW